MWMRRCFFRQEGETQTEKKREEVRKDFPSRRKERRLAFFSFLSENPRERESQKDILNSKPSEGELFKP